ncbi:MAG: hypothetical protein FJY98_00825 [Candidatus Liptonbacteria bacterium]|nr:hypothetical protein [Candidatus Liptonbacteria bacterium]
MLITLYGPDDYRRIRKKQQIIGEFLKKHSSLGLEKFDCANEEALLKLQEFGRNESLFDPQRLAVLDAAWEAPEGFLSEWLPKFENSKTVTILLAESEVPKKDLNFLLKAPAIAQEFEPLEGKAWEQFIVSEAKMRGVSLAPDAAQLLSDAYAGDNWRLITELERFVGEKRTIQRKELEELGVEIRPEFFALARRFGYGDKKTRLAVLEAMFLSRDPAAKIFNILSAMTPGAIGRFATYDAAVKSGKLEYEEALTDLTIS